MKKALLSVSILLVALSANVSYAEDVNLDSLLNDASTILWANFQEMKSIHEALMGIIEVMKNDGDQFDVTLSVSNDIWNAITATGWQVSLLSTN